jgi:hypothetical protein
MKLVRKIVSRMLVAGLVLGTPSAVLAREGGRPGNDGPSQGEVRAALVGLMNAATAALNSGACSGESIPELPE